MTSPEGPNGIDIPVTTHVVGDPAAQARTAGEQAARAFSEGASSTGPVELPGFDGTRLLTTLDESLARIQERIAGAARTMGVTLNESIGGGQGLRGSALATEMERYQRLMEASVGSSTKSTWVRGFADALQHDVALLQRGVDAMATVTDKGRAMQWGLTEEGRQFVQAGMQGDRFSNGGSESFAGGLQHGMVVPAPPRATPSTLFEPGDLDKATNVATRSLSRVVLDNVAFAFEDGNFFRVNAAGAVQRAKGPVDDPEMLARLQTAVVAQLQGVENQIVRQFLGEITSRDPRMAVRGLPNPADKVGSATAADVHGLLNRAQAIDNPTAQNVERLNAAIPQFASLGVSAETIDELRGQLARLVEAYDQTAIAAQAEARAARAAAEAAQARAARSAQITGAFEGDTVFSHATGAPIGTTEEMAQLGRDQVAEMVAQIEAMRVSHAALDRETAERDLETREIAAARALIAQANARTQESILASNPTLRGLLGQQLAAQTQTGFGGGGRSGPPPPASPLGTPGEFDENFFLRALALRRQLAETAAEEARQQKLIDNGVIAATRSYGDMEAVRRRVLAAIPAAGPGSTTGPLGPGAELTPPTLRGLRETGAFVGPSLGLKTDSGDIALFNAQSGAFERTATAAEAMAIAQQHVAETTRASAAAALDGTRSVEALTQAELREFIAAEQLSRAQAELGKMQGSSDLFGRAQAALNVRQAQGNLVAASSARMEGEAPGGFITQFVRGLTVAKGTADGANNAFLRLRGESGEFLGAIARYQAAYAVIFTLTRGFGALLHAEEDAQDQQVEFSRATELSGEAADQYVRKLDDIAAAAGGSVAQAMAAATNGIFAFQEAINSAPKGQQQQVRENVGTSSVHAAVVAQVLTGSQNIEQSQQLVLAATKGFNLGFDQQTRVLDAATSAMHNYGGSVQQILASLPIASEVARQAGIGIEETSNLIALIQSHTAQSGTAAGTTLARILESVEKPNFSTALRGVGVNVDQSQMGILEQLAKRWNHLTDAQRENFTRLAVGTRGASSFLAIMQAGQGLIDANARSFQDAGTSEELYFKRLDTLSGIIRGVGGDFKKLAIDLAATGAVDTFGLLLKSLDPLLHGIDDLLRLVDDIPNPYRAWLTNILLISAALTVIGRQQTRITAETLGTAAASGKTAAADGAQAALTGGGLLSRFRRAAPVVPVVPAAPVASRLLGPNGLPIASVAPAAAAEEEAATARFGALGRGAANLGRGATAAAGAFLGPLGLVAGAVALTAVIGGLTEAAKKQRDAQTGARNAQAELTGARSADELRAAASALGTAAVDVRHANGGIFGGFTGVHPGAIEPDALRQQGQFASAEASRLETEQNRLSHAGATVAEFFSSTDDHARDLATGMDAMTNAGVPAVRQLKLVAQALGLLDGTKTPPKTPLSGVFGTETTVNSLVGSVRGALAGFHIGVGDVLKSALPDPGAGTDHPSVGTAQIDFTKNLETQLAGIDPKTIRDKIHEVLDRHHIGATDIIDPATQDEIAREVLKGLLPNFRALTPGALHRIQGQITGGLGNQFGSLQTSSPFAGMSTQELNDTVLGNQDGKNPIPSLDQRLAALAAFDDPRKPDSTLGRLRAQTTLLQGAVDVLKGKLAAGGNVGAALATAQHLLQQTEHDAAEAEWTRAQRLIGVLNFHESGDPGRLIQDTVRLLVGTARQPSGALTDALATGAVSTVEEIINSLDKQTLNRVVAEIRTQIAIQQAVLRSAERDAAELNATLSTFAGLGSFVRGQERQSGDNRVGEVKKVLDALNRRLNLLLKSIADSFTGGPGATAVDPNALAQARILASARSGDPVSEARAAVAAAAYARDHAKNELDRIQAIKAYNDAERQLTDAITAVGQAIALANVRPGDPVSAATGQLRAAAVALHAAIPGTAAWYQAEQSYHDAQYQLGQAQLAAAHNARLLGIDTTNPVQTAREDLRAATAQLHRDQRNGTGDINADLVAQRQAAAALAGAKFTQRLQDATTAHDLGTLSDAAYLRFLEHQDHSLRAQMAGMKKTSEGYRQAQDELNQVDQAIKAASDQLSGMFNIGDIRIPTPYEARRYIKATSMGLGYLGDPTGLSPRDGGGSQTVAQAITNHVNITIHANADLAEIKRLIHQALGGNATGTTSYGPKR